MYHNVRIFGLKIEAFPANGETVQRATLGENWDFAHNIKAGLLVKNPEKK